MLAITRNVSRSLARCELSHRAREPIDVELARSQHGNYERRLAELGCRIERLAEEPELPDAVFVEDAAVVLPELAVITRPGAVSRRGEIASVAQALAAHRPLARIRSPGTLDGGDVLRLGQVFYVGLSQRTNQAGIEQLADAVAPHGYSVRAVPVKNCLHLKSAATAVAEDTLLIQASWLSPAEFPGVNIVEADPAEPGAANALRIWETVIHPTGYPRTADILAARGIRVLAVEVSELMKAEGGVTCCSLILDEPGR